VRLWRRPLPGVIRLTAYSTVEANWSTSGGIRLVPSEVHLSLFGAGFGWARPSTSALRSQYTAEIFYRYPLYPNFAITPDVQLVMHSSRNPSVNTMWVFGVSGRLTFRQRAFVICEFAEASSVSYSSNQPGMPQDFSNSLLIQTAIGPIVFGARWETRTTGRSISKRVSSFRRWHSTRTMGRWLNLVPCWIQAKGEKCKCCRKPRRKLRRNVS